MSNPRNSGKRKQRQAASSGAKVERRRKRLKAREAALRQRRLRERLETREKRLKSIGAPLLRFFEPLGLEVELEVRLEPSGHVRDHYRVDGHVIARHQGGWEKVTAGSQEQEIDSFVAQHLAKRFVDAVTTNAAPLWPGARAYYTKSDHGFVLAWPDAEVGFVLVTPTHARIFGGGPTLRANYLLPGAHWERLKRAIERHAAKREATPSRLTAARRRSARHPIRVPIRNLEVIPEDAPRATVKFLMEASRRLRLERKMVYGSPVVLESAFGEIKFEPIEGAASHLVAPFKLACQAGLAEGGIALSGEHDPLRVELYHDEVADDVFVWSTALSGYADLTTWDLVSVARAGRSRGTRRTASPSADRTWRPRRPRGTNSRPSNRRLPRSGSTAGNWPAHLTPLGDTARNLESVVAGHRRLLPPGWTPSAEAVERASLVGIRLGPGETWVRPHQRGAPTFNELRFAWKRRRALTAIS